MKDKITHNDRQNGIFQQHVFKHLSAHLSLLIGHPNPENPTITFIRIDQKCVII